MTKSQSKRCVARTAMVLLAGFAGSLGPLATGETFAQSSIIESQILAGVNSLKASMITLQTSVNAAQSNLNTQHATLTALQNSLASLQSQLNSQAATLASIQARQRRKFYLTDSESFDGAEAANACAAGFHMASLWEIFDPSNLVYDRTRGLVIGGAANSAEAGPPNFFAGWIREGGARVGSEPNTTPGARDCLGYTSADAVQHGTLVGLSADWGAGSGIQPWVPFSLTCDQNIRVWCLQD